MRGLTQAQLAERLLLSDVSVDRSAIAHVESGRLAASAPLVAAIAEATGFPPAFFDDETSTDFPEGTLLFRAKAAVPARSKAQAREWGTLLFRRAVFLSSRVRVPGITLPRISGAPPEVAASHARAALGLSPHSPIPHVINALERAGVLVLAIPVELPGRDAFSAWAGDPLRPVVVLVRGAPGDRQRFSTSHEVGHLVMHSAAPARIGEIEAEAGRFAAEFLMPTAGIAADLDPPITLTKLAPLKMKWGVAIQALVRRARTLGSINDNQYTYLFQQIAMRGWRLHEPSNLDIPVEKPRALRKMAEVIYGNPPDYRQMAGDLNLYPQQVRQILDAYATAGELPPTGSVGAPRVIAFPRPVAGPEPRKPPHNG